MIYPRFIEKGDMIGIAAPSDGNRKETDFIRLDYGKKKLDDKGFTVIETAHVRNSDKGRSTDGKTRARELENLILSDEVKWIISAKGGDFLVEMLPHLNLELLRFNPKWIQGYSDNTGITFTITTNCNIATIYGCNFNDFGMEQWHKSIVNNLDLIMGKNPIQYSFDYYEDGFYDRVTGLEVYRMDKPVYWRNINSSSGIKMTGRLLGGCLDVLLNLVGTKYDNTVNFINQYKEDGILWYLESFSLNSEALTRGLWQLKEAGWFETARGFIFGRPAFFDVDSYIPYDEAVLSVLEELNVPVILDADIGHKAPQMTMVNGAIATMVSNEGKGTVTFEYR
jgi:muramoyltetrapeptide carboxypeptidase LdcA involved in peptidoglycan recycling